MNFKAWHRRNINWFRVQRGKWGGKILGSAPLSSPYNQQQVKKILLLRNDNKLGDSLVSSVLLRGLKQLFPSADIDVVAGTGNALMFQYHPFVRHIVPASRKLKTLVSCAWKLRKEKYDLYLDLDETPTFSSLVFLRILRPRWALGFNRNDCSLYNLNIQKDISSLHITKRLETVLRTLGFQGEFDSSYQFYYPNNIAPETSRFIENLPKKLLVINPLAASKHRSFTVEQIEALAQDETFSSTQIILIGQSHKLKKWLGQHALPSNCCLYDKPLFQAIAVVKRATLFITPDTFWVHAACALKVPTLAVYQWKGNPQGPYAGNVAIWHPLEPCVKMLLHPTEQPAIPPHILLEAAKNEWHPITAI